MDCDYIPDQGCALTCVLRPAAVVFSGLAIASRVAEVCMNGMATGMRWAPWRVLRRR